MHTFSKNQIKFVCISLQKTTSAIKMENPWNIDSIYELQFYNCPCCVFKDHSKQTFINHAINHHPEAVNSLTNVKDDSLSDVVIDIPANLLTCPSKCYPYSQDGDLSVPPDWEECGGGEESEGGAPEDGGGGHQGGGGDQQRPHHREGRVEDGEDVRRLVPGHGQRGVHAEHRDEVPEANLHAGGGEVEQGGEH